MRQRHATIAVVAVLLAGCDDGKDTDSDTATDTSDVVSDTLAVYSLDPVQGPLSGGTVVTVLGRGFVDGVSVTFGTAAAVDVTMVDGGELTLTTPPATESGVVDVTVQNPGGETSTLVGGYTYTDDAGSGVDWCRLQFPSATTTTVEVETEMIYGQAYVEGCTETEGEPCMGLAGQVGHGPVDTDPSVDPSVYTWTDTAYNADFTPAPGDENNDEFQSTLAVDTAGTYAYAFRFSMNAGSWLYCDLDGSDSGVSTDQLGTLTVEDVTEVTIGWCNLQHPASTETVATVATEPIYGRVWVEGCTDGAARCATVTAQVGWGDGSVDPSADPSAYSWTDAAYNPEHTDDDNDEFVAPVTPDADGTYSYTYRLSGDLGVTWTYCDLDGNDTTAGGFSTGQMGTVTVSDHAIGWCNLQSPDTITTTAGTSSDPVYGRVYVASCTDGAEYCGGVLAQVGYGAPGEDPSTFDWISAEYNPGHTVDDNDEYSSTLSPATAGTYEYAYRFSGDGGETWTYCDTTGSSDGYASSDAGVLTAE